MFSRVALSARFFEYDANANRTALIDDGQRDDYRINFSNNWLLETETADYRYDNAGNIVERGTDAFVYDSHHRLIEATVDGTTATFAYNVQHQRVSKSVGGTTTRFFYGQGGELLSERMVGTGLTEAEYVWLDGKPLAYLTNGQVYQVHTDHLGTPQVLTDASGTAAWEAEYRPFGEAVTTGNLSFPLRFPGQYHDTETVLHYNWHRYYDPATGRYLTSDPIGLEGGVNPYLYAEANPLYFTDPEGLCPWCLFGAVVGGGLNTLAQLNSDKAFSVSSLFASIATGAAGGGLGTVTRGLAWRTSVIVNTVGSGAIGAGVTSAKNEITGSCDDVLDSARNAALLGGSGALTSAGFGAGARFIGRAKFERLPDNVKSLITSNSIHDLPKNPYQTSGVTMGNAVGGTISNIPTDGGSDQ